MSCERCDAGQAPGACPNCGTPTETHTLYRTNGDVIVLHHGWCDPCLRGRVAQARSSVDVCHCSQAEDPHRHEVPA